MIFKTENSAEKQTEQLRYERKYLITDFSVGDVKQLLKFHPACFSQIFHERVVNNIYFDTLGFTHYYDNVNGSPQRCKIRIRWYGETFGKIQHPVLEFKIKKGLLGKKDSYVLQPFLVSSTIDVKEIERSLAAIPSFIRDELHALTPTLLNSYTRQYFLSADKKFRITIDHHLNFYQLMHERNVFLKKRSDHQTTILELKYDSSDEVEAKQVSSEFPFALTKSSKYLQGLEQLFF